MEKEVHQLLKKLDRLGFDAEYHEEQVRYFLSSGVGSFTLFEPKEMPDSKLDAQIKIEKDALAGNYDIDGYHLSIYRSTKFEHATINGIDTRSLVQAMETINWSKVPDQVYQDFFTGRQYNGNNDFQARVIQALTSLWRLGEEDNQQGARIRDILMYRMLSDTPFEQHFDLSHLKKYFALKKTFDRRNLPGIKPYAYNALLAEMSREHRAVNKQRWMRPDKSKGKKIG